MATLQGKTLFISGGSRGIGLAIALRAARDGANIVIAAKTAEPHPKLPRHHLYRGRRDRARGWPGIAAHGDIRDEEQVKPPVDEAVEKFGGIDILVNNASAISLTGTLETPMKRYDLMFGVNTRGTFRQLEDVPAALIRGAQSAHPQPLAAAEHEGEVVRAAPGLHDGQVRHEHVRAGDGGGVPPSGRGGQCALAAHRHRDGRVADDSGRRSGALPQAGDHGRCRPRGADAGRRDRPTPATSTSTTTCWLPRTSPTFRLTRSSPVRRSGPIFSSIRRRGDERIEAAAHPRP